MCWNTKMDRKIQLHRNRVMGDYPTSSHMIRVASPSVGSLSAWVWLSLVSKSFLSSGSKRLNWFLREKKRCPSWCHFPGHNSTCFGVFHNPQWNPLIFGHFLGAPYMSLSISNDRLETPTLQLMPSCKHNRHVLTTLDTNLCHYVKMSCFFRFLLPPSKISSFKNTGTPQKKSQAPLFPPVFVPVEKCPPKFPPLPRRFSLESSERTLAARSCTSKTPQALPICNSITCGGLPGSPGL